MEKLTINKSGTFTTVVSGDNHCGTENPLAIRYTAKIRADGSELDSRGFLFDQLGIQIYFDSIKHTSLSCEMLAEWSVDVLRKMVIGENPKLIVEYVYLSLSPSPFTAMIECEWTAERGVGA